MIYATVEKVEHLGDNKHRIYLKDPVQASGVEIGSMIMWMRFGPLDSGGGNQEGQVVDVNRMTGVMDIVGDYPDPGTVVFDWEHLKSSGNRTRNKLHDMRKCHEKERSMDRV